MPQSCGMTLQVVLLHVQFPATVCEDSSSASLVIRNSSTSSSQVFEFGVPQGSCLKVRSWTQSHCYQPSLHRATAVTCRAQALSVSRTCCYCPPLVPLLHCSNAVLLCAPPCFLHQVTPRVGLLAPQSSLRVQVDFSPPAAQQAQPQPQQPQQPQQNQQPLPAAAAPASSTAIPNTTAGHAQQQQPGGEVALLAAGSAGQYQEWLLPCFIKQVPGPRSTSTIASSSQASLASTHDGACNTSGSSGSNSSGCAADCVLHVAVTMCCIANELRLVSPQLPRPPGKNYCVLDFGALPVGERTTRELLLENMGESSLQGTSGLRKSSSHSWCPTALAQPTHCSHTPCLWGVVSYK